MPDPTWQFKKKIKQFLFVPPPDFKLGLKQFKSVKIYNL